MYRSFFTVLMGGLAAQFVVLVSTPLLAQLYQPASFGYLASALSISSIFAATLHGRYHMVIPLAKDLNEARGLFWLATMLILMLAVPAAVAGTILTVGQLEWSLVPYVLASLALMVGASLLDVFSYWFSYRDRFNSIAHNQIVRSVSTVITQIALSFVTQFGMLVGAITGMGVAVGSTLYQQRFGSDSLAKWPGVHGLGELAWRYRNYPLYGMPQGLVAASSWNFLPIALFRFQGPDLAGHYWVAYRLLIAPLALFNLSYRQAALQIISRNTFKAVRTLRLHTFGLALCGIVFSVICYGFSEFLAFHYLGENWKETGSIAAALSLGIAADFFKVPSLCLDQALQRHKHILKWEISIAVARFIPCLWFIIFDDPFRGIQAFALTGLIGWTLYCATSLLFRNSEGIPDGPHC